MIETNTQEIAAKLQSLERQIIVLKDCYVTLHNDLIHRKIDPERSFVEAVNQKIRDMGIVVKEFKDKLGLTYDTHMRNFEWISNQLDRMFKKMEEIEKRDQKRFAVKVSLLDESKDPPKETPIKLPEEYMADLANLLSPVSRTIIMHRLNGKSFVDISRITGRSYSAVISWWKKGIRKACFIHKEGKADLRLIPTNEFKQKCRQYINF